MRRAIADHSAKETKAAMNGLTVMRPGFLGFVGPRAWRARRRRGEIRQGLPRGLVEKLPQSPSTSGTSRHGGGGKKTRSHGIPARRDRPRDPELPGRLPGRWRFAPRWAGPRSRGGRRPGGAGAASDDGTWRKFRFEVSGRGQYRAGRGRGTPRLRVVVEKSGGKEMEGLRRDPLGADPGHN